MSNESQILVRMTSDEARLVEGLRKIVEKENQVVVGLTATEREAMKAEKALDRYAQRTKEINTTPLERYTRELQKAEEALRKGKLTQEEFNRERDRLNTSHAQAGTGAVTQQKDLASAISAVAMKYNLVQFAIEKTTEVAMEAFRAVEAEQQRALTSVERKQEGAVQLQLIAGRDPARYQQLVRRADSAAMQFGVDPNEARKTLAIAHAEGFAGDFETLLSGSRLMKPGTAANLREKLPQMFPGLGADQALDLALAARKLSGVSTMEEYSALLPGGVDAAQLLKGTSPTEGLAALAALRGEYDDGGQKFAALAKKLRTSDEFAGKSLGESIGLIARMNDSDRTEFSGGKPDVLLAAEFLAKNWGTVRAGQSELDREYARSLAGDGLMQGTLQAQFTDPYQRTVIEKRQQEIKTAITGDEVHGLYEARRARKRDEFYAYASARGGSVGYMGAVAFDKAAYLGDAALDLMSNFAPQKYRGVDLSFYDVMSGDTQAARQELLGLEQNVALPGVADDLRAAARDLRDAAAGSRTSQQRGQANHGRDQ